MNNIKSSLFKSVYLNQKSYLIMFYSFKILHNLYSTNFFIILTICLIHRGENNSEGFAISSSRYFHNDSLICFTIVIRYV